MWHSIVATSEEKRRQSNTGLREFAELPSASVNAVRRSRGAVFRTVALRIGQHDLARLIQGAAQLQTRSTTTPVDPVDKHPGLRGRSPLDRLHA
jgi:hypothetical protein